MPGTNFEEVVEIICQQDSRYHQASYSFVREGLDHTLKHLKRQGQPRHVTGPELLEGLRRFTLEQFGPLSRTVLGDWGINTCRDFGEIVFNLVNHNVLQRSENDRLDDFTEVYQFDDAFEAPFRPTAQRPSTRRRSSSGKGKSSRCSLRKDPS